MHVNMLSQPMNPLFLMITVAEGQVQPTEAKCVIRDWMDGL